MKKKTMENLYNYITDPNTIVTFVIFVFTLGATWSNLNGRIKTLEEKAEEIDITKIEIKLAEIQKDLQRIRDELDKSSGK